MLSYKFHVYPPVCILDFNVFVFIRKTYFAIFCKETNNKCFEVNLHIVINILIVFSMSYKPQWIVCVCTREYVCEGHCIWY